MVNKTTVDSTSASTSSSSSSSAGSSSPSSSATHDDPLSSSGSSSTNARSTPHPVPFTGSPGVAAHLSGQSLVDFFLQLIDDILRMIHRETVRYLEQYMEDNKEYLDEHPKVRVHELSRHPITLEDIKAFIAILIGMGICGFPSIR